MALVSDATVQATLGAGPNDVTIRKSVTSASSTVKSYFITANDPAYGRKALWVDSDPNQSAATVAAALQAALAL